jgi:hypothetical protein
VKIAEAGYLEYFLKMRTSQNRRSQGPGVGEIIHPFFKNLKSFQSFVVFLGIMDIPCFFFCITWKITCTANPFPVMKTGVSL